MKSKEYLSFLKNEIHSTVFATVDEKGLPYTCVIDIMLCDDDSLYFLTAKGKNFYDRLTLQHFVSISGTTGIDTLSTVVVSVRGKVRELGNALVSKVFEENPYMKEIYPKKESRKALTVFQLYEGEGEFFDLRQCPPFRDRFAFGGMQVSTVGYEIKGNCDQCGECLQVCPSNCIEQGEILKIRPENCIHCGCCAEVCPKKAIKRK